MIDLSLFQCAPYAVRTSAPMARHHAAARYRQQPPHRAVPDHWQRSGAREFPLTIIAPVDRENRQHVAIPLPKGRQGNTHWRQSCFAIKLPSCQQWDLFSEMHGKGACVQACRPDDRPVHGHASSKLALCQIGCSAQPTLKVHLRSGGTSLNFWAPRRIATAP